MVVDLLLQLGALLEHVLGNRQRLLEILSLEGGVHGAQALGKLLFGLAAVDDYWGLVDVLEGLVRVLPVFDGWQVALLSLSNVGDNIGVVVVVYGDIAIGVAFEHVFPEDFGLLPGEAAEELDVLVCTEQFRGQQLHLSLELFDLLGLGVVIPYWSVGNHGGFGGVGEGAEVFFQELLRGVQAGDHAAEGIAAQALPQEAGQLRVSVGHIHAISLAISKVIKSRNDLPQSEQRLVNLNALLLRLALGSRVALPLGAGQVDDLHFADDDVLGVGGVHLLQAEGENGVGAGAAEVHLVGANYFVAEAEVEEGEDLFVGGALEGEQVLYGVDVLRVPLQLQALRGGVAAEGELGLELEHGGVEQVVDLLVVDLHEGHIDGNLPVRPGKLHLLKEKLGAALDDAYVVGVLLDLGDEQPLLIRRILVALHGVGLAGASLPVGEHRGVEAFDYLAHQERELGLGEQLGLSCQRGQHLVEAVALGLALVLRAYPNAWVIKHQDYSMSLVSSRYLMLGCTWESSDSPSRKGLTRTMTLILLKPPGLLAFCIV